MQNGYFSIRWYKMFCIPMIEELLAKGYDVTIVKRGNAEDD